MAKKRKECIPYKVQNRNHDRRFFVDRREIMKVTRKAKAWEFTCSFCFKKFPSAQAMDGHQNAHRMEQLGGRRVHLNYATGYRKKAYIPDIKEAAKQAKPVEKIELNAAEIDYTSYALKINGKNDMPLAVTNALPPMELSLVENAGVDEKGEAYMDLDIVDGYGIMELGQKLDSTLKL